MRIAILAIVLGAFWMLLSGFLKPLLLAFGLLSIGLCLYFANKMRTADEEGVPVQVLVGALTYMPWLMWEIVKSSFAVAQIILDPKLPIRPTMAPLKASQKTPVGVTVYANSITLTPGTITVEVDDNDLLIHALVSSGADELEAGDMDRRVTQFEGSA